MIKTHAPTTMCGPFDSATEQAKGPSRCAHRGVIAAHLGARRPAFIEPGALAGPLGLQAPSAMATSARRRVLRPAVRVTELSTADRRFVEQEQAVNRLVRPWMTPENRRILPLIVHALPSEEQAQFSELASLVMQQASPKSTGWELMAALLQLDASERFGMLLFCHEVGLCSASFRDQVQVVRQLSRVAASKRPALWACATDLCGHRKRLGEQPRILKSLAAVPSEQWPAFTALCLPLVRQHFVPREERINCVIGLADTWAKSQARRPSVGAQCRMAVAVGTPDAPALPGDRGVYADDTALDALDGLDIDAMGVIDNLFRRGRLAEHSPWRRAAAQEWAELGPASEDEPDDSDQSDTTDDVSEPETVASGGAAHQAPGSQPPCVPTKTYDAENVQRAARIRAANAAVRKLRQVARPVLPTRIVLKLVEAFMTNLYSAPDAQGGFLHNYRAIKRHARGFTEYHEYTQLDCAMFALHAPDNTAQHKRGAFWQQALSQDIVMLDVAFEDDDGSYDSGAASSEPVESDDELSDTAMQALAVAAVLDADDADDADVVENLDYPDVWSNGRYPLGEGEHIGLADLAATVWTAIDSFDDPALTQQARADKQLAMRLDFVANLAFCVEDDNKRVCPTGTVQRLLEAVRCDYALDVPLYTAEEVVSACARALGRRYPDADACPMTIVRKFYIRKMLHAHVLFAGDAQNMATFQKHMTDYLAYDFKWTPVGTLNEDIHAAAAQIALGGVPDAFAAELNDEDKF